MRHHSTSNGWRFMRSVDCGSRPNSSDISLPAPANFPFGDAQVISVMSFRFTFIVIVNGWQRKGAGGCGQTLRMRMDFETFWSRPVIFSFDTQTFFGIRFAPFDNVMKGGLQKTQYLVAVPEDCLLIVTHLLPICEQVWMTKLLQLSVSKPKVRTNKMIKLFR
jgi:hypothetical protein